MSSFRIFIVGFASLALLAGCQNTVQGFGQDLEKAGEKIQGKKTTSTNSNVAPASGGTTYSTETTTYDSGTTHSTSPTYGDVY